MAGRNDSTNNDVLHELKLFNATVKQVKIAPGFMIDKEVKFMFRDLAALSVGTFEQLAHSQNKPKILAFRDDIFVRNTENSRSHVYPMFRIDNTGDTRDAKSVVYPPNPNCLVYGWPQLENIQGHFIANYPELVVNLTSNKTFEERKALMKDNMGSIWSVSTLLKVQMINQPAEECVFHGKGGVAESNGVKHSELACFYSNSAAGTGYGGPCRGDSGAPMICKEGEGTSERNSIYGLVSFGPNSCNATQQWPAAISTLYGRRQWLKHTINGRSHRSTSKANRLSISLAIPFLFSSIFFFSFSN